MKRPTTVIVMVAAVCILTACQSHADSNVKVWGRRGPAWLHCSAYEKYSYVQGVLDGLAFADFKVEGAPVPTTVAVERLVKAVDQFYEDERTHRIPVPFTVKLMSLELSGKSKAELAGELGRLRERFQDK